MKTCYIYARTATTSQYEQSKRCSKALELQIKSCEQFARENGYEVYKTFSEVASGTTIERNELKKLLNYCKRARVDAVIIFSLDRLSRKFDDYQKIMLELNKKGIKLLSVNEGSLIETPIERLRGGMLAAIAQYELERSEAK